MVFTSINHSGKCSICQEIKMMVVKFGDDAFCPDSERSGEPDVYMCKECFESFLKEWKEKDGNH